jgi:hypothetical protein
MTKPSSITLQKSDGCLRLIYTPPNDSMLIWGVLFMVVLLSMSFLAAGLQSSSPGLIDRPGVFFPLVGALGSALLVASKARERIELELGKPINKEQGPFRESHSSLGRREIRVRYVALMRKKYSYSCDGLRQIYCAKNHRDTGRELTSYDVAAMYDGGSTQVIAAGIHDLATAQFIEFTLESELKIKDRNVSQEVT